MIFEGPYQPSHCIPFKAGHNCSKEKQVIHLAWIGTVLKGASLTGWRRPGWRSKPEGVRLKRHMGSKMFWEKNLMAQKC